MCKCTGHIIILNYIRLGQNIPLYIEVKLQ